MPIDAEAAKKINEAGGGEWSDYGPERSWNSKDCLLYALGVGAGQLDPTGFELEFTTENSRDVKQRVLPTFAVIVGGGGGGGMRGIGTPNTSMLVDGGREIILHKELPVEGKLKSRGRTIGVYDKGSGTVVASESESIDPATGEQVLTVRSQIFLRGEGGWGGERGPGGGKNAPPDREPDHAITYQVRPDQALLYRLSGDRNPLHSDPTFAKMVAQYPKPILHGLCTYGFTGRALLHTLCGSDPAKFKSMEGRFSKPVMPGDALTVKMWVDGNEALFTTENQEGAIVLDQGKCTFA